MARCTNNKRNTQGRFLKKHGHSATKTYRSWANMMARCYNPNSNRFYVYGAKGITVCSEWFNFLSFLSDMGERPHRTSLDRIDNLKGYSKQNCRWAAPKVQMRNRSVNVWIEIDGIKKCATEWAEIVGIKARTIMWRKRVGWSDKDCVSPLRGDK